jgi:PAS domain S-box-containing protein
MFRCPAAEAMGQHIEKFIPQRYHEAHRAHVEKFGRSSVSDRTMGTQRPLKAVRADGEEFFIEASISQIELGGTKLFTAMVRDVTLRHKAAEAIAAAEARFRTMFANVAVGVMMVDSTGAIIEANPACEKMLGYSAAELHGTSYVQITHPQDILHTRVHTTQVTGGTVDQDAYEKRYLTKDGKRIWARVIFSVVRDTANHPLYFIKFVEDITRQKRAKARARRMRAEHAAVLARLATLTSREAEVMWLMVEGLATKVIASELGASPKTIDVHRGRVMEKMQAESVAMLVQMVIPIRNTPEALASRPPTQP